MKDVMADLTDGSLTVEPGESLEFPVEGGHPLETIQRMHRIESLGDVRNFQFVQEWSRGFSLPQPLMERPAAFELPKLREPPAFAGPQLLSGGMRIPGDALLALIRERTGGVLLVLQLVDFIIPPGSTVTLNRPLAEIVANTVVIGGQLKFTDDLSIRCNEIRGS